MCRIILLITAIFTTSLLSAQNDSSSSPIIFIYDASGSMWGQMLGKTKMAIASDVLSTSVNNLSDDQKIGLVVYGHRKEGDCKDVEFLVDAESGSKTNVIQALKGIKPLGKTPLAYSALQVINKLRLSKQKATIILVTDGIESCDGNICDVIKAAKEEGIDFKLHIIGFGIKNDDTQQLKCAAEAGGGKYYDAENEIGLGDVLEEATSITVDKTKGNVTVYAIKNGIPIDVWVKAYDVISKRKPILLRTYKDTGDFYLPPSKYNLEVFPLEGSDVDMITIPDIESFDDSIVHQAISFDGGKFGLTTTNNGEYWDCIIKIFDQKGKVASSFRTYTSTKEAEVNPGIYKVTIQALRMEGMDTYTEMDSITIRANETTPISYNFKTGEFEIFTRVGDENIDAIVTVDEVKTGKNVGAARTYDRGAKFLLNPGKYKIKVVPLKVHKDKATQTIIIELKQGELITKEIKF